MSVNSSQTEGPTGPEGPRAPEGTLTNAGNTSLQKYDDDDDDDEQFSGEIELRGAQEVPPAATNGEGEFEFELNDNALSYELSAENLNSNVTQAHIHLGACGTNGAVVAFLFGFLNAGVPADGELAEGTLTDAEVIARPGFDGTLAELVRRMRDGDTYVNVHTISDPPGEIRGQIGDPDCDCKDDDDDDDDE